MTPLSLNSPSVRYFSSSLLGKKSVNNDWRDSPIPFNRQGEVAAEEEGWTYEEYFKAIEWAVTSKDCSILLSAAQEKGGTGLFFKDLQDIAIYAEKHGNWYHPGKITLTTAGGEFSFVVNVALHARGQAVMEEEVKTLEMLGRKYSFPWIPRLYAFWPSLEFPGTGKRLAMFLADWFEGYHEFHLSCDPRDGRQKLVLWDGTPGGRYLSPELSGQVFRLMAKILTSYYDLSSHNQIFPWHQAAGDFVAKIAEPAVDVRLITVRHYGPLTDPLKMAPQEALLFFFLNLSMRIRLDRLEGTGETAWADETSLAMTWQGFLEGLGVKEEEGTLPTGFLKALLKDWSRISERDLIERFLAILESYDPRSPDRKTIEKGLAPHVLQVYELLRG
jgi:hypothetical protein